MEVKDVLVVNPGSTSSKIAVFGGENSEVVFEENIIHDETKILVFPDIVSQKDYRKNMILDLLQRKNYDVTNLSAVVGRGGMAYELEEGGYRVNEKLCRRMAREDIPRHASNLGAILAFAIAEPLNIPSYIYDATMGCHLLDIAKITGMAEIEKYGVCHLLNSRAQAMRYAKSLGKDYRKMQFIICHMGGGITASAWRDGKVIDTASYDDGPMSPERSGGVPLLLYKKLCFSPEYDEESAESLISGKGGLYSYLGTKDCKEIERRIAEGDDYAAKIYEAMAFQIGKSIAGLSCALEGKVDFIVLTGRIAYSRMLTGKIKKYCGHIGSITVMAGEREMEALAEAAVRMLKGEEIAKRYE